MRPDIRPARDDTSSLEVLGTIGPAGVGTFLVAVVATARHPPGPRSHRQHISEYDRRALGRQMTRTAMTRG